MRGLNVLFTFSALALASLAMASLGALAADRGEMNVPATAGPFGGLGEKAGREMELRGVEDTLKASEDQRRQIEAKSRRNGRIGPGSIPR